MPPISLSDEPQQDLFDYIQNYINEEIKLEGTVRKIDFFHRFLNTAAHCAGELTNYANVARDMNSDIFGKLFEHFLIQEVRAYVAYKRLNLPLHLKME